MGALGESWLAPPLLDLCLRGAPGGAVSWMDGMPWLTGVQGTDFSSKTCGIWRNVISSCENGEKEHCGGIADSRDFSRHQGTFNVNAP